MTHDDPKRVLEKYFSVMQNKSFKESPAQSKHPVSVSYGDGAQPKNHSSEEFSSGKNSGSVFFSVTRHSRSDVSQSVSDSVTDG